MPCATCLQAVRSHVLFWRHSGKPWHGTGAGQPRPVRPLSPEGLGGRRQCGRLCQRGVSHAGGWVLRPPCFVWQACDASRALPCAKHRRSVPGDDCWCCERRTWLTGEAASALFSAGQACWRATCCAGITCWVPLWLAMPWMLTARARALHRGRAAQPPGAGAVGAPPDRAPLPMWWFINVCSDPSVSNLSCLALGGLLLLPCKQALLPGQDRGGSAGTPRTEAPSRWAPLLAWLMRRRAGVELLHG